MKRRALAAVAALVLALVGTVAVLAYAKGADRRAVAGQEAVPAYVVRKDVPAGTTAKKAVDDGLIVQELIARKGVPEGALTTADDGYQQLVALTDLAPGELVLKTRFGTQAPTAGTLLVPDGRLAVSVDLDDTSHVGTFLQVGSMVAVFDTFNVQEADKKDQSPAGDKISDRHEYLRATRLLLPSVAVLAIGATTTKVGVASSSSGQASDTQQVANTSSTTTLVTLSVTQDQAQRIIHAARTGTMSFALLGPGAIAVPGPGVDDRRLFGGAKS